MHYIQDISGKITDVNEKYLPEINARVKDTNGKVADINKWLERAKGGGAVIMVVLFPLLCWGLWKIATLNDTILQVLKDNVATIQYEK